MDVGVGRPVEKMGDVVVEIGAGFDGFCCSWLEDDWGCDVAVGVSADDGDDEEGPEDEVEDGIA